jgi:hypothetical protein
MLHWSPVDIGGIRIRIRIGIGFWLPKNGIKNTHNDLDEL